TKDGVTAVLEPVLPLLTDRDAEVRAQAAKVLGDHHALAAYDGLIKLLADQSPRVRFFAAQGLGKLGRRESFPAIVEFLRQNGDSDRVLRHAGVMALIGANDADALLAAAKDTSPAVRMGVLLAMRRLERGEIAGFLNDAQPAIVLEAARAINDTPISGAVPELAAILEQPTKEEWLTRRTISANFRYNTADSAKALAHYATRGDMPANMRVEALNALADWPKASGRDRVTGLWRPIASTRDSKVPADAVRPILPDLIAGAPDIVRAAAAKAAEQLQISEAIPALRDLARNTSANNSARVAALRSLASLNDAQLASLLDVVSKDDSENVRREAVRLSARVKSGGALEKLNGALVNGSLAEKQNAFATLGTLNDPAADSLLSAWVDKLAANEVPAGLKLDVLDAAGKRKQAALQQKLADYAAHNAKDNALAPYLDCLTGGNAENGKKIFFERADVACVRCHKIGAEGGEVGPNLAGIGTRQNREYILESVVFPNLKIAAGFESVLVTTKGGPAYAGTVKSENDQQIVINSPEDGVVTIKKSDITKRDRGLSPMPEAMASILTKFELRDLVEFLATAK
ncbi:MAG TPA: HEAT repeat domain-containing protein, partial [Verrucomicrobiae bacterium]|nr:HEAT repeat domain-containing protein [Verrucomicrobiae bacterium]